jgi:hypothetical protein
VDVESAGEPFVIHATFANHSDTAIGNPFFEVIELTGDNRLENADGGPAGVGGTFSPDVGDGILSPGESMTATFVIRLDTREPFGFRVSMKGRAGS